MKKTLIALAALTGAASVQAQSNVTLYGVIDQSVAFTSNVQSGNGNVGRQVGLQSAGGLEGSRWGLRGSEDLGQGLRAFFQVENGFDLGNGRFMVNNTLFNRQALVGLSSNKLGSVSFGRQSDFVVDFVAPHSQIARYARTIGAAPFDLNNFDYTNQMEQSIKYVSPSFGGFYFGGAVALGGVAGSMGRNMVWSVGAGYNNGPFKLGLAYTDSKNAAFNPLLTKVAGLPAGTTILPFSSFISTSQVSSRYRVGAIGATYDFGKASLSATYSYVRSNMENTGLLAGILGVPDTFNYNAHIAELSGAYKVTPAITLGLGYSYTRMRLQNQASAQNTVQFHQITAGASYALSRRTEIYATVGAQRNVGNGPQFTFINGTGPSGNRMQYTARIGLRHVF